MKKILLTIIIISIAFAFSACTGDATKPSKQDVKNGYYKMTAAKAPTIDKKTLRKVTDCIIDNIYNKLSVVGANTFANANLKGEATQNDLSLVTKSGAKCGKGLIN